MTKVFVVQDSPGKNLLPARDHGEMEVILSGNESIPQSVRRLTEALTNFKEGDSLLLVGNPMHIGIATHIVATMTNGKFAVLIWDRHGYKYVREEITL